jgi:hypothetical protein
MARCEQDAPGPRHTSARRFARREYPAGACLRARSSRFVIGAARRPGREIRLTWSAASVATVAVVTAPERADMRRRLAAGTRNGRAGTAEDVAATIAFLAVAGGGAHNWSGHPRQRRRVSRPLSTRQRASTHVTPRRRRPRSPPPDRGFRQGRRPARGRGPARSSRRSSSGRTPARTARPARCPGTAAGW